MADADDIEEVCYTMNQMDGEVSHSFILPGRPVVAQTFAT